MRFENHINTEKYNQNTNAVIAMTQKLQQKKCFSKQEAADFASLLSLQQKEIELNPTEEQRFIEYKRKLAEDEQNNKLDN